MLSQNNEVCQITLNSHYEEHKKYEFGNKVSIVRTWGGLIIGALSFRNEYDGHTIDRSKEQVDRIYGRNISIYWQGTGVTGDRRCPARQGS